MVPITFREAQKYYSHWISDENTVGGPIDVAIITKEDGFVWVDTKQSYDPMKNPRHMDIDRSSSNFR